MFVNTNKTGFSFIEVIIVVAIITIFAALSFASFPGFNTLKALETDVQSILATLEDARSNSLRAIGASKHGVYFETSRFVLFKGTTYSSSDPDNKEYPLQKTSLSSISLAGGGSDVIFEKLNGKTNQPGTITVSVVGNPSHFKVITIHGTGIVEFN